jgi:hypothetical protein
VDYLPDPTHTREYGLDRVNPRVRVYPQTPSIVVSMQFIAVISFNYGVEFFIFTL